MKNQKTTSQLLDELATAEKMIIVLQSNIESYKKIVDSMEQLTELLAGNHKMDIKLNYTKNK